MPVVLSLLAILAYVTASMLILKQLYAKCHGRQSWSRKWTLTVSFVGIFFHSTSLYFTTFTPAGIDFGLFNIGSIISGTIFLILLLICVRHSLEHLAIVVLPLACITLALNMIYPESHFLTDHSWALKIHVILSLLAYSIISLGAIQAVLFAIQNDHLHNRKPTGFIRILPPLSTMEALLFKLIEIGFILLTLALASGFIFLEDLFAQHVAHKTVLSMIAWLGFGVLLWGRFRYGWRGKKATRWTIFGAIVLMMAYLGSKIVIELILS